MKVIIYKCHDRHTDDYIKIYEYSPENLEAVKQKVINDWESLYPVPKLCSRERSLLHTPAPRKPTR